MNAATTPQAQNESNQTDSQVHPMSEYEKFLFDLKGFLVIPGVLTEKEVRIVREHIKTYTENPESLPEHHRAPMAGPAEFIIDHPRVMGILQEMIDPRRERIRLESIFISSRSVENTSNQWRPHVGGTNLDPSLTYRFHNGRIYSGMTRIVWELNEVKKGQGGTCLVPGSHKANLASAQEGNWPEEADDPDSGVWETYGCPPGSLVVFSEGVRHTGSQWTNPDNPRCAILMAYNHVAVRHHEPKPCMNPVVIGGMSEERQGFFKDVWVLSNDRRNRKK
ncbi:MAG: phytanoyl-CoA dioxygenase family protein [Candidatus Poribacteria bacterium]|nr:phytanoyl-CoA dioxygenase family protein [Candidatus Poribacteria bacterium]